MSFYDITYSDRIVELLPPDKRTKKHVAWWQAIVKQLTWNVQDAFKDYKTGSSYPIWGAASYNLGDRVIYGQSVYESLANSNTAVPTNTTYWRVYELFFIGSDERIMYNGQNLVLNYALNKRFGTNFKQPPLQSDIYFTVNQPAANVFVIGANEANSSVTYSNNSGDAIINSYSFTTFYNFIIHVPVAVLTALSSDVNARNKIISNFVDNYLPAGLEYTIQTY